MLPEYEPTCWRREWDGDESDLGAFVHADSRDELDEHGPWEPLYGSADWMEAMAEIEHLGKDNADLREKLAASEKDAERWRWLKIKRPREFSDEGIDAARINAHVAALHNATAQMVALQ